MGYVESNLMPGEVVEYRADLHWLLYVPHILLMFVIIGIFTIIPVLIRSLTTEMVVTNKRVIMKQGLISRKTLEMALGKIETVGVDQGFWARIFGYGTLTIVGTGGTKEAFPWVAHPLKFRQAVQHQTFGQPT